MSASKDSNASRKRSHDEDKDNGLLLVDEPRSEEDEPDSNDLAFLDDDSEISANEDDIRAINRSVDAALEGVIRLNGEEVSVSARDCRKPRRRRAILSESPSPPPVMGVFPPSVPPIVVSDSEEEEVSVQAHKAIAKNQRKADGKVKGKSKAKRKGLSNPVAAVTDRGCNQRNWCFTIYDGDVFKSVFEMSAADFPTNAANRMCEIFRASAIEISYLCAGKETCPTTDRLHLQCFVQFATKKRISFLKKVDNTIHWESCKGNPGQNRDYCRGIHRTKSLTVPNPLFSEFGDCPLTGAQSTQALWVDTLAHARKGDMLAINPRIFVTQVKNLEHISRRYGIHAEFVNLPFHTGVWIWSKSSGRGKTDCLKEQFPFIYLKAPDTQWNDYSGEEHALIDDFALADGKALAPSLKLWTAHQGFTGRVLYGTVKVHLRRLFVTSNYSIERIFLDMGPEIYEPIRMRFRQFDWDRGDLKWSDRAKDCWSEDNIMKCPLGEIYDGPPI